jgi:FkbM family methyltransferase
MKKAFYWGDTPPEKIEYHTREIFERQDYELLYPVKEGDVVVDIGACLGEFTWKNMDKASQVYAIEPDTEKHEELDHNIGDVSNVEVIKKAFHHSTGTYRFPFSGGGGETYVPSYEGEEERLREWGVVVDTINFKDFIKEYNLDKIDFLRTSCQGGEYSLFRDENLHFLKNNVRNIVGNFYQALHLGYVPSTHGMFLWLVDVRS